MANWKPGTEFKLNNDNQYIVSHAWTFLHKQKYSLIVNNNFRITVELAVILSLKSCKSVASYSFEVVVPSRYRSRHSHSTTQAISEASTFELTNLYGS